MLDLKLKNQLRLGTALGLVLGAVCFITPDVSLAAPQPPAVEPEDETTDVEELVIVGSRIRRDVYNSASPVQVITREESTLAGFNSTADTLQSNAVTGGGGQINNAFGGFVTEGGPGANTLGLRGLGASRTLILLNGRRLAPAGTRGAVGQADLNVLPTAIIDRFEILKDGASSIYGSDAVAGVVNIVTRRGIESTTVEGQYNWPDNDGGESTRISVVSGRVGSNWEISGSAEYYQRNDLTLAQRDWTQCNTDLTFVDRFVSDESADFIDPLTGLPKCYPITFTGSNGVTINTLGTANTTGVPAPGTTRTVFNRWRPNSAIGTGLVGFEGVGGTGVNINVRDTFEPRMLNESLISPVENKTFFAQGSYDTGAFGSGELYFEQLFSQRESQQTGYRQLSLDYITLNGADGPSSLLVPTALQTRGANFTPAGAGLRAFIGFGNDTNSQRVEYFKTTIGMRGDFLFTDWRYDFTGSTAWADASYTFESFLTDRVGVSSATGRVGNSLNVVTAPAGFDPTLVRNGITCAINLTNPAERCIPAPPLNTQTIGGILPEDFKDYIFVPVTGYNTYKESIAAFNIDGPLFALQGGDIQAAFGVEYRRAVIDDTPPFDSQIGNLFNLTSAVPTRGADSVWEAYGEVEAPIFADLRFVKELTVNLSGRYTDYASYGEDTTYKVGANYAPFDWVTLRATYGTSYRAPALFEQFQGASTGFLANSADPCHEYGELPSTSIRFINCHAEIGNTDFLATSGVTVITAGGAGTGLAAETSTNLNYGVVLQPALPLRFGDLQLAVDYYDIEIIDGVDRVGAGNILDRCYDDPQFRAGGGFCRLVAPRAFNDNNKLTVFDSFTNVATVQAEGLDYNLRYTRDVGPGTVRVNAILTQYFTQASKLFDDDPLDEFNGTIASPEYTADLELTYTVRDWRFRYGVEWVAATDSYELVFGPGVTAADAPNFLFETPDYYVHRLSVQYTQPGEWQATAGVRNLFDEEPPVISSGAYNKVGNAPLYSGYDYVGRTFFVNLSKIF